MTNEEILKAATQVSKPLAAAISADYINRGQAVPATIIELIHILHSHKKK